MSLYSEIYRIGRGKMLSGMVAAGLFAAMLLSPEAVSEGAQKGLLLWFRNVLPTLFPFMIATGLMISCGGMHLISGLCGRLFSFLISSNVSNPSIPGIITSSITS